MAILQCCRNVQGYCEEFQTLLPTFPAKKKGEQVWSTVQEWSPLKELKPMSKSGGLRLSAKWCSWCGVRMLSGEWGIILRCPKFRGRGWEKVLHALPFNGGILNKCRLYVASKSRLCDWKVVRLVKFITTF